MRASLFLCGLACVSAGCTGQSSDPKIVPVSIGAPAAPAAVTPLGVEAKPASPLELPVGYSSLTAPLAVDFEWDNYWWSPTRYAEIVYTWQDWRLVNVRDNERQFAHVRVEYRGVLQFMTIGSGRAFSFHDSEDWRLDLAAEESYDSLPPADPKTPTWQHDGMASNLIVEDLTRTGGCTLVLVDFAGERNLQCRITFLHLREDGRVKAFGPYGVACAHTRTERVQGDTEFILTDDWLCFRGCNMGQSPEPQVRVSMKGGTLRSCNGTWDDARVSGTLTELERCRGRQESEHDMDDYLVAEGAVFDLLYHGRAKDALALVMDEQSYFGEAMWLPDTAAREVWWRSVVRRLGRSTLAELLEREFPQVRKALD